MTVVTTAEHGLEAGERETERDLGYALAQIENLISSVADHATTLDGLKGDKEWTTQRLEAIERDIATIPRVPEELASTTASSIADLTHRLERLEGSTTDDNDDETLPPQKHENESENETENGGDDNDKRERRGILNLDSWF